MEESKAQAICRVAGELFAAQGYAGTSIEEIAAGVGIHKSTIFHYVGTKQDLLALVLENGLYDYLKRLEEIVADDHTTFRDRLVAALLNHMSFVFDQQVELTVFLHERRHLAGDRGQEYIDMAARYEGLIRDLIAHGMVGGEFLDADPALATLVVLGASNWMVHWYDRDGRLGRKEVESAYVDLLVNRMLVADGPSSV